MIFTVGHLFRCDDFIISSSISKNSIFSFPPPPPFFLQESLKSMYVKKTKCPGEEAWLLALSVSSIVGRQRCSCYLHFSAVFLTAWDIRTNIPCALQSEVYSFTLGFRAWDICKSYHVDYGLRSARLKVASLLCHYKHIKVQLIPRPPALEARLSPWRKWHIDWYSGASFLSHCLITTVYKVLYIYFIYIYMKYYKEAPASNHIFGSTGSGFLNPYLFFLSTWFVFDWESRVKLFSCWCVSSPSTPPVVFTLQKLIAVLWSGYISPLLT